MTKFLLTSAAALAFAGLNLAAQETVTLTFDRAGASAESVKVSATTSNGEELFATMNSVSTDMKTSGPNVTSAILCPNVNGNTNPTITMSFTVDGLPEGATIESIGLDIHALNGGGEYQAHDDGPARMFNVDVNIDDKTYGRLEDIDIAKGVNPGGARHKIWDVTSVEAVAATSPLELTLTITKGQENLGCFFGLSEIQLVLGSDTKETTHALTIETTGEGTVGVYNIDGESIEDLTAIPESTVIMLEFVPAEGYELKKVMLAGFDLVEYEMIENNTYLLGNLEEDTTLEVVFEKTTGIATIAAEELGQAEVYNLQGVRVAPANVTTGLYVVKANGTSAKVYVK